MPTETTTSTSSGDPCSPSFDCMLNFRTRSRIGSRIDDNGNSFDDLSAFVKQHSKQHEQGAEVEQYKHQAELLKTVNVMTLATCIYMTLR